MHQCIVRVNFSKCTPNGPSTLASAGLVIIKSFNLVYRSDMNQPETLILSILRFYVPFFLACQHIDLGFRLLETHIDRYPYYPSNIEYIGHSYLGNVLAALLTDPD